VIHRPTNKRSTYAALVEAACKLPVPDFDKVQLKRNETFNIIGHDTHRVDSVAKVNGAARYGIDSRGASLLFAVVARPKAFGGKVLSSDSAKARLVPGVKDVVTIEPLPKYFTQGGVVVIADSSWAALKGREALRVEWDPGPSATESTDTLQRQFHELMQKPGLVVRNDGDADAALRMSRRVVRAEYELPFAAHATMEPMNCTVDVRQHDAEAWVPTQGFCGRTTDDLDDYGSSC
jgi:isoquinoline 1-oxidoreductase beta subunit